MLWESAKQGVYRLEKEERRKTHNTHNDRILSGARQGPVHIAGSGPGRDASMRRKRGELSATHNKQLSVCQCHHSRRASKFRFLEEYSSGGIVGDGGEMW